MTHKYIEILQGMIEYENIFTSDKVDEKVISVKTNSKILITILNQWLATHSITEDEIKLIESTIKNL
jgi:3-methyladenine DNA glycosylase AlkC